MKSWIKYLFALNLLVAGCGSDKPAAKAPPAPPPPIPAGPAPVGGKLGYQEMQGLMNTYCKECHTNDPFIQSEVNLKSSKVQVRMANKTMPPGFAAKKLPDNIRTQMLSYF